LYAKTLVLIGLVAAIAAVTAALFSLDRVAAARER
jgi:hypothetical protein